MLGRVGRTDKRTDRRTDSSTDNSPCITAIFYSSYKFPKTVTVTQLLLFGSVTLICVTFLFILLSDGSVQLSHCEHQINTPSGGASDAPAENW